MAGNTVQLVFAGDSASLEKTFGNVGSSAQDMAGELASVEGKAKSFGGAMDGVGSSVGGAEGKFAGSADLLDGLGGAFGLPTEGATGLMRSMGDLSGGFEVVSGMFSGAIGKLGTYATSLGITSAATKVWTGIQAAFNVVMSLNPVTLIVIAIVALVAALILAYQKSETFRDIVQGAFEMVKKAAEKVWDFIKSLPEKILGLGEKIKDAVLWPYKTAFNLVAKAWNATVGKLSFSIPDWVPGLGGKGFSMPNLPEFHRGGIVPGPAGTEVPILAMAGERVTPPGAGAGGNITVIVQGSVVTESQLIDAIHEGLLRKQRRTPLGLAG